MRSSRSAESGFLLAALGLIYGDIATSPLYVLKYIVAESGGAQAAGEALAIGSVSLIIWALLLLATVKGVFILLRADNRGEGGLFALYALVRGKSRGMIVPAALGGAALLADSVLTPALTFTAAVEGSRALGLGGFAFPGTRATVFAALALLSLLFMFQGFGNRRTARFFGPVMLLWLLFIGAAGAVRIPGAAGILRAFDPRCGLRFLFSSGNTMGIALLGLVFLSVTGTEMLYANLDFGGRKAITRAWPLVLICLILNYLGQGAWLMSAASGQSPVPEAAFDPFFLMLPPALRVPALVLALAAAWSASQTVINGSFTLVSEAVRLDLLPPLEIRYPSDSIRQEYIPAVNLLMWLLGCAAVLVFKSGRNMASAYGLTIAAGMLMTTVMLFAYRRLRPLRCALAAFGVLEASFLIASLPKLLSGGAVTLLFTLLLLAAMLSWSRGSDIEKRFGTRLPLREYIPQLLELRERADIPKITDNLVYIEKGNDEDSVDCAILYSILDRGPKRAQAYWFVTVNTVDEPYLQSYHAETFGTDCVFRLRLDLGYKCSRPLTRYLREAFLDMERQGRVLIKRKDYCLSRESSLGTFQYCVLRKTAGRAERFTTAELLAIRVRDVLQRLAGLREEWYEESDTNVEVEWIPMSLDGDEPEDRIRRLFKDS